MQEMLYVVLNTVDALKLVDLEKLSMSPEIYFSRYVKQLCKSKVTRKPTLNGNLVFQIFRKLNVLNFKYTSKRERLHSLLQIPEHFKLSVALFHVVFLNGRCLGPFLVFTVNCVTFCIYYPKENKTISFLLATVCLNY